MSVTFRRESQMKDAKRRLKQRCETDLKHIHDAIQKADLGGVINVGGVQRWRTPRR